jgi:hypothetical protein
MANGQIITTEGLKIMMNRTYKETPDYSAPSVFEVGTGTDTPAVGDTDLQTAVEIETGDYTKELDNPTLDETAMTAEFTSFLNSLEANGNSITEMGIFNTDGTPKLWSRAVFNSITKTNTVEVSFTQVEAIE